MDQLSLRERNKQRVTQRIITASVELFKTQGYHQTTMDDIAEKAEISRGTLFNYFPSKEALLLPWTQEILDHYIRPKLMAYMSTQPTSIQVLGFLYQDVIETVRMFPDVIQAFVRESLQPNASNDSQKMIVGNGVQDLFLEIIHYGQARGEIRSDIPSESLARYLGALQMPLLFSLLEPSLLASTSIDLNTLLAFIQSGLSSVQ